MLKVKSKTKEALVAQMVLMGALEFFPGAAGPRDVELRRVSQDEERNILLRCAPIAAKLGR